MGRILILVVTSVLILAGCVKQVEPKKDVKLEEAKLTASKAAGEFMKELKTILVAEMKKGGPESALNVCSDTAQEFAKTYSTMKGMELRRVSFMNRNEANVPDDAELMWLKECENMMKADNFNKDTVFFRVERSAKSNTLHLAKPILLVEECVVCHGTNEQIPGNIKKLIAEKYPNDKAVNFSPGDLRGLVSVKMKF
ncbi:MAG: DUF3365 domain-containing protein [Ignavibacteriales bacterium]|nr:DUF3365 domain-containing protein [Ignavibacteriales bacterium]